MSKELVQALDALEQEKGIKAEVLVEAIEEALKKAYEKNYDESENVEVQFDQKKGNIKVYSVKTVVEEIDEPYEQITLEEALELNKAYEIGDEIRFEVTPADFGRLAAHKQLSKSSCKRFAKLSVVLCMTSSSVTRTKSSQEKLSVKTHASCTSFCQVTKRSP